MSPLVSEAAELFCQMPADDRRLLLEVLRRIVAGAPREHALEQVPGAREAPAHWLNS